MQLKVMTFNVQHFRDYNYPKENRIDLDFFAKYISSKNADIVGLNEVFNSGVPPYEKQAFQVAQKANYPYVYFAKAVRLASGDYGNAMLAKYPFEGESIPVPDPQPHEYNGKYAETRCVLRAEFLFEGKRLTVLCCHFGLNDMEARNAVQTVCKIANETTAPILLMGDFNFPPSSPLLAPLYEIFEGTERFLERNAVTYPSDCPNIKIDYIFGRGIKFLTATVFNEVVSDHRAVQAEIEL